MNTPEENNPEEYIPVYQEDFVQAADQIHLKIVDGVITWNAITKYAGPKVIEKTLADEQLTEREQNLLETITDEEIDMYVHANELSYFGLKRNFENGYIAKMKYIGTKRLMIVERTLINVATENDLLNVE